MNRQRVLIWGGGLLFVIVMLALFSRSGDSGLPFDPDSPGPAGTKALRLLIEEYGADVDVVRGEAGVGGELDRRDADVVLVIVDRMASATHTELREWVQRGNLLVLADGISPLGPDSSPSTLRSQCTIDAFAGLGLENITVNGALDVGPDDDFCLGTPRGAAIVSSPVGEGRIITFASPQFLVNESFGSDDNAVAIAAAVVPRSGRNVVIIDPNHIDPGVFADGELPGFGDESLWDLVPDGVKWGLLQLIIAFLVLAAARAWRHGHPVPEPLVVNLAGSELVAATGTLHERTAHHDHAAQTLRENLHRTLVRRLGLPAATPDDVVAKTAAERLDLDPALVARALDRSQPAGSEQALLDLATRIHTVRQEVLDG